MRSQGIWHPEKTNYIHKATLQHCVGTKCVLFQRVMESFLPAYPRCDHLHRRYTGDMSHGWGTLSITGRGKSQNWVGWIEVEEEVFMYGKVGGSFWVIRLMHKARTQWLRRLELCKRHKNPGMRQILKSYLHLQTCYSWFLPNNCNCVNSLNAIGAQSGNLRNLEIALHILGIPRLHRQSRDCVE